MSYIEHHDAATAKAHAYVREVLGLNPLDLPSDDYKDRNDYDDRLKAFLAGVFWALDELPNEAEGAPRV